MARTRPTLTPRKRQIVGLVAQGMTNKQIAHHLAISVRTVDAHLEQIRNHLGVRSRVLLAAWASSNPAPPCAGDLGPTGSDGGRCRRWCTPWGS